MILTIDEIKNGKCPYLQSDGVKCSIPFNGREKVENCPFGDKFKDCIDYMKKRIANLEYEEEFLKKELTCKFYCECAICREKRGESWSDIYKEYWKTIDDNHRAFYGDEKNVCKEGDEFQKERQVIINERDQLLETSNNFDKRTQELAQEISKYQTINDELHKKLNDANDQIAKLKNNIERMKDQIKSQDFRGTELWKENQQLNIFKFENEEQRNQIEKLKKQNAELAKENDAKMEANAFLQNKYDDLWAIYGKSESEHSTRLQIQIGEQQDTINELKLKLTETRDMLLDFENHHNGNVDWKLIHSIQNKLRL